MDFLVANPTEIQTMCDLVRSLGLNGATINVMALELGLSLDELADARKEHLTFDKAVRTALDHSLGWHEKRLIENADNKAFSSQTATAILRSGWPDQYEGSVYRKESAKAKPEAKEDYQAIVNNLLRQLRDLG